MLSLLPHKGKSFKLEAYISALVCASAVLATSASAVLAATAVLTVSGSRTASAGSVTTTLRSNWSVEVNVGLPP